MGPINTAYLEEKDWMEWETAHPEAAAELKFRSLLAEAEWVYKMQIERQHEKDLASRLAQFTLAQQSVHLAETRLTTP